MEYENVDIDITLDELYEKIKQPGVCLELKVQHLKPKEMPKYTEMRDQMIEDEMWSDLERLDYNGDFPSLRYGRGEGKEVIDEVFDAVREGIWLLDKTELRYLKENKTEFYSGNGKILKMVMRYSGN